MTCQQVLYDNELFIAFFSVIWRFAIHTSKHGNIRLLHHAISQEGNASRIEAKAPDNIQPQQNRWLQAPAVLELEQMYSKTIALD